MSGEEPAFFTLLLALQGPLGLQLYTRHGPPSSGPVLSVPLLLWSMGIRIYQILGSYAIVNVFLDNKKNDVGSLAFTYSGLLLQVGIQIGLVGLTLNSKKLVEVGIPLSSGRFSCRLLRSLSAWEIFALALVVFPSGFTIHYISSTDADYVTKILEMFCSIHVNI